MKYKHYFAAMTATLLLLTGCQQIPTATPEKDTSIQALTETQPHAPEITPLTNIVRCDPITLPDDISRYTLAERIGEGFSGIVNNMDHQPTYLHISEDMQTAETFVLTPPEDQGDYSLVYQWFALEDGGMGAVEGLSCHHHSSVYRHSDLYLERSGQPACICRIGVQHLCILDKQPA